MKASSLLRRHHIPSHIILVATTAWTNLAGHCCHSVSAPWLPHDVQWRIIDMTLTMPHETATKLLEKWRPLSDTWFGRVAGLALKKYRRLFVHIHVLDWKQRWAIHPRQSLGSFLHCSGLLKQSLPAGYWTLQCSRIFYQTIIMHLSWCIITYFSAPSTCATRAQKIRFSCYCLTFPNDISFSAELSHVQI